MAIDIHLRCFKGFELKHSNPLAHILVSNLNRSGASWPRLTDIPVAMTDFQL